MTNLECPPFQLIRVEVFFLPFRVFVEDFELGWRPIQEDVESSSSVGGRNYFEDVESRRVDGRD
jgi:hypothetical protein